MANDVIKQIDFNTTMLKRSEDARRRSYEPRAAGNECAADDACGSHDASTGDTGHGR